MVSYMVGKRAKRRTKDEGRYISLFWKYPKLTVLFITIVETALYFDRGAIAVRYKTTLNNFQSAIPKIQFFWGLDAIEEGVIASIFTVGTKKLHKILIRRFHVCISSMGSHWHACSHKRKNSANNINSSESHGMGIIYFCYLCSWLWFYGNTHKKTKMGLLCVYDLPILCRLRRSSNYFTWVYDS